jgi:hypothetical protein
MGTPPLKAALISSGDEGSWTGGGSAKDVTDAVSSNEVSAVLSLSNMLLSLIGNFGCH